MNHGVWLVPLGFVASCSDQDQTLGETRPPPPAIIVPDPTLNPTPDPTPTPGPNPTIPPCEDRSLHARVGACVPAGVCSRRITHAGYECEADAVCCDQGVGNPQGGAAGDESAGAAGQP